MIARKKRQKNDQFNYVVAKHDGRTNFIPTSPPKFGTVHEHNINPGFINVLISRCFSNRMRLQVGTLHSFEKKTGH